MLQVVGDCLIPAVLVVSPSLGLNLIRDDVKSQDDVVKTKKGGLCHCELLPPSLYFAASFTTL